MASKTGEKKPSEVLSNWPKADIDAEGTFKYVLIEACANDDEDNEVAKWLVRGYKWAEYHADIYDHEEEKLRKAGLDGQCLGGGRILHEPDRKYIKVYGYSQGFGRADHTKTVDILKEKYGDDYTIKWSNDGY